MQRRTTQRSRSYKGGKILFNNKRSVISCTVRNLSAEGANLQVESALGVPAFFDVLIEGEPSARPGHVVWKAPNRIGVAFSRADAPAVDAAVSADALPTLSAPAVVTGAARGDVLSLRLALDEVPVGIVLLDANLRAQFINRAFRAMWRLPEAKAESRPAFATLMYHGRDTRAYDVPENELAEYVEARVAHVRDGNPTPIDVRLTSGEIIRFQCTKLPAGGRMLNYTDVTDIVRRADELERLRSAFDNMGQGVILLDEKHNVEFINVAVRRLWQLPDEYAASKPAFTEVVAHVRKTKSLGMADEPLDIYMTQRIARVRAGDPRPMDMRHRDGRIMRSQCTVLPNGGRMITYTDVTDLIRREDEARKARAVC